MSPMNELCLQQTVCSSLCLSLSLSLSHTQTGQDRQRVDIHTQKSYTLDTKKVQHVAYVVESSVYRALLRVYTALMRVYRALLSVY